jgi:hypothetical protein
VIACGKEERERERVTGEFELGCCACPARNTECGSPCSPSNGQRKGEGAGKRGGIGEASRQHTNLLIGVLDDETVAGEEGSIKIFWHFDLEDV